MAKAKATKSVPKKRGKRRQDETTDAVVIQEAPNKRRPAAASLQRTIGNQQLASLVGGAATHYAQRQNVITLPPLHITGDPQFYTRARRLNQYYFANPPLAGWPYNAALERLWQSGQHDEFADKVRELQETQLGLTGKDADGVLGPQTARLMTRSVERAEPAAQPEQPAATSKAERMAYVMKLLVDKYGYPPEGAAGLVGNLHAESGLLPNRIEGSNAATPMRARNAQGQVTDFTNEEAMNRRYKVQGPQKPGIGLAQWTTAGRRKGLFAHEYAGVKLGAAILNNRDAQVDYLVKELESKYKRVNRVLKNPDSLEAASDEVVFNFERPGKVLKEKTDKDGKKLPGKMLRSRDDPLVQPVLNARRAFGQEALAAFTGSK
ncbi:MAG: hypothetical protein KDE47_10890 [Caldilineaceae bacterium]|nr:hypothetical protein [Caldilineaceae bacterium]